MRSCCESFLSSSAAFPAPSAVSYFQTVNVALIDISNSDVRGCGPDDRTDQLGESSPPKGEGHPSLQASTRVAVTHDAAPTTAASNNPTRLKPTTARTITPNSTAPTITRSDCSQWRRNNEKRTARAAMITMTPANLINPSDRSPTIESIAAWPPG